jgi:hypothetical protein
MPLNFYELYKLLSENTVSQELKKIDIGLKESLVKIKSTVRTILPNFNEKSVELLSKWFFYTSYKSYGKTILDNKENPQSLKKLLDIIKDSVRNILNGTKDFFAYHTDGNGNIESKLASKLNNVSFKLEDLLDLNQAYHYELSIGKINRPGSRDGKVILNFPDGYKWLDLKRGRCEIEGIAGKHCGNAGEQPGDTILSLRDKKDYVHLTFILNNGILEERKGKANTKPKEEYHPYILELLKLPIIKGLGKGRYAPENDFQLSDLSEEEIQDLIKVKPEMKMIYYKSKLLSKKSHPTNRTQEIINQNIPPDVLVELSDDKDYEVRQAVAMNKNTPIEIIIKLNNDTEDGGVIRGVCLNPNTPKEILLNHSEFSDVSLAITLASNPSLPQKGLFNIFNRFINGVNYAKITGPVGQPSPLILLFKRLRKRNDLPKEIEEKLNLISNKE